MQLSKRLQMSADFAEAGCTAADVGCDHAYMAIALIMRGTAVRVIAMDVNAGPLKKARENIERYGLADRIETRLSDGIEKLRPGEADTILCAGMGGALMIRILSGNREASQAAKHWILQPQSEIASVRRYIWDNGFHIAEEAMCEEDGKFYTSIHAVRGEKDGTAEGNGTFVTECGECEIEFGAALLQRKDPVLAAFLKKEKALNEQIRETLERQETQAAKSRLAEIEEKLVLIEKALAVCGGVSR